MNEVTEHSVAVDWKTVVSKLRRYVYRRVGAAFSDDVLGEILLRLVRHKRQLAAADNPSAWMYRTATNAISDHYRRRAVEQRVIDRQKQEPPGLAANTEADPARQELSACLGPLVRGLPAPYAEALLMTDINGLSQAAAAQQLGLSVSGMKSRVQRGRAHLKQALLRCCEVELDAGGRVLDFQSRSVQCKC